MFSSWQVQCGIANYTSHLVAALRQLGDVCVSVVPFDRQSHQRQEYVQWGKQMNASDVAHVQHEYSFFGYLFPWQNHFDAFATQISKPLVITRHVSFDGPLSIPAHGIREMIMRVKWALYNRWLGPYARYLNKDTFERANQIIVLSKRLKDHLVQRGLSSDKIHVIPAGVPELPPVSRDESAALRASWGWSNAYIVCQFGYIAPAKGHMLALEALARLPQNYVLLIAGGIRLESHRWYLDALQHQITRLGLGNRVRITGYLDESAVSLHIAASDLLIYPNTHADFSYSVVTGLARKTTPALASDIDSHRELAEYCKGLSLFRSGDAEQLAAEIQRISTSPSKRQEMLEATARFTREYSWRAIAQRTLGVYQLCLNSS